MAMTNISGLPDNSHGKKMEPFVRYTLTRSKLVGSAKPNVYSGDNLEGFDLREDVSASTELLDGERAWLFLELPARDDPQFAQLAFRD